MNHANGEKVPEPYVLATGKAVGLANHTLLIARDGTRRPIDARVSNARHQIAHVDDVRVQKMDRERSEAT